MAPKETPWTTLYPSQQDVPGVQQPDLENDSTPGALDGDRVLAEHVMALRDKLQDVATYVGDAGDLPADSLRDTVKKCNYHATSNPGVEQGSNEGYANGSRWINAVTGEEFVCVDDTAHAAVWEQTTGASGTDPNAIHKAVSGEISSIATEKTDVKLDDLIILESEDDSYAKRKVQITNIPCFHQGKSGEINALAYVTPAGTDVLIIEDASDSFAKKKALVSDFSSGSTGFSVAEEKLESTGAQTSFVLAAGPAVATSMSSGYALEVFRNGKRCVYKVTPTGMDEFSYTHGTRTVGFLASGTSDVYIFRYITVGVPLGADFTDLEDVPSSYIGAGGKAVSVKGDLTGLEFTDAGASAFEELSDVESYAGHADEYVKVNGTATGLTYGTGGGGGSTLDDAYEAGNAIGAEPNDPPVVFDTTGSIATGGTSVGFKADLSQSIAEGGGGGGLGTWYAGAEAFALYKKVEANPWAVETHGSGIEKFTCFDGSSLDNLWAGGVSSAVLPIIIKNISGGGWVEDTTYPRRVYTHTYIRNIVATGPGNVWVLNDGNGYQDDYLHHYNGSAWVQKNVWTGNVKPRAMVVDGTTVVVVGYIQTFYSLDGGTTFNTEGAQINYQKDVCKHPLLSNKYIVLATSDNPGAINLYTWYPPYHGDWIAGSADYTVFCGNDSYLHPDHPASRYIYATSVGGILTIYITAYRISDSKAGLLKWNGSWTFYESAGVSNEADGIYGLEDTNVHLNLNYSGGIGRWNGSLFYNAVSGDYKAHAIWGYNGATPGSGQFEGFHATFKAPGSGTAKTVAFHAKDNVDHALWAESGNIELDAGDVNLHKLDTAPTSQVDRGRYYTKEVAGIVQAFYKGSDGTEHQLTPTGGGGYDSHAFHDNEGGEISALSSVDDPGDTTDYLVVEDRTQGYGKRKILISQLPTGSGDADAIHKSTANEFVTPLVPQKNPPDSVDKLLIEDGATGAKKYVLVSTLPQNTPTLQLSYNAGQTISAATGAVRIEAATDPTVPALELRPGNNKALLVKDSTGAEIRTEIPSSGLIETSQVTLRPAQATAFANNKTGLRLDATDLTQREYHALGHIKDPSGNYSVVLEPYGRIAHSHFFEDDFYYHKDKWVGYSTAPEKYTANQVGTGGILRASCEYPMGHGGVVLLSPGKANGDYAWLQGGENFSADVPQVYLRFMARYAMGGANGGGGGEDGRFNRIDEFGLAGGGCFIGFKWDHPVHGTAWQFIVSSSSGSVVDTFSPSLGMNQWEYINLYFAITGAQTVKIWGSQGMGAENTLTLVNNDFTGWVAMLAPYINVTNQTDNEYKYGYLDYWCVYDQIALHGELGATPLP